MGLGGRAFKKLPFILGVNSHMIDEGSVNAPAIAAAQAMGMTAYRNDLVWNNGTGVAIEGKPGVYNSSMLGHTQATVAALKAAGIIPLVCVTSYDLCPTLSTALVSGTNYSSIGVTNLSFAITSGDTIVITDPATPSHTQTITAAANMAASASGALSVTSFNANANYATGCWVFDSTNWSASTPQQLANTMAWLVAQSGLQGVHWEIINEPDGDPSNVTPALLTKIFQLAYPAMKAADPTCVVHGLCIEHASAPGFGVGIDYYNLCATAGIVGHYDILSIHEYNDNASVVTDQPPDENNIFGWPMWRNFANFRTNMIAKGDTVPIWITECNWPYTGQGNMTPQLQAQYLQTILVMLSGMDPLNNVLFSSYIHAFCVYQMYGSADGNWGLYPPDFPNALGPPNPAVAVLTALTQGT